MRAYERLLNYVKVYTTSEDEQENVPSTSRQFDLGNQLAEELKKIGVQDVRIDDKCYVYGVIPATGGMEEKPAIGFIAHMDTAPDFSGENVNPQIIPEYDGGDVKLGDSEYALTLKDFPHLASLKGRTLITTDGSTLLGADDKAGVAEIMTMAEQVITENIPHGKICIGFTPDEEVGRGADFFDVEGFGADFAYTVDGGAENEIEYENFNAAAVTLTVEGVNIHPGSAKNKMKNAILLANQFISLLPAAEAPAHTEGYEGFYHVTDLAGNESQVVLLSNGQPVAALYALTGDNREKRAMMGSRMALKRQNGVTYGGELLAGADYCGLDEESLRLGFNLVVAEWAA